ncbi:unnamed protein product, partial [Effrenium voratum]
HFRDVTTTNRELMKPPMEMALCAKPELRAALAEPSGDVGRAGRSSWHYNIQRPLGRKVKLHNMASAKFDGDELPHLAPWGMAGQSLAVQEHPRSSLRCTWGSAASSLRFSSIAPDSRPATEAGTRSRLGTASVRSTPRGFESIFNQSGQSTWAEFTPNIRHPRLW